MRIATIMPTLPFPGELRAATEARALVGAGFQVSALSAGEKGSPGSGEELGVDVERIARSDFLMKICNVILKVTSYRRHPLWSRRIKRFIGRGGFNLVHVHELKPFFVAARAARKAGLPVVLDLREDYPEMEKGASRGWTWRLFNSIEKLERIQRDACVMADAVLVVSPMFVEVLHRRYPGVPREKMVLVSNYADVEVIEQLRSGAGAAGVSQTFTITYVGSMGSIERGIQTAIAAMPRIREAIPGAKLLLFGDGGYVPVLRKQVASLGLDEAVEFGGWVPFETVPDIITRSTVCVVPSLNMSYECDMALPLKLFQYMLMERPVVVSDCHELKRVVEESGAGLVFRAGDARDLADRVIELEDPRLRRSLGERGRLAVLEEYNFAADGRRLAELFSRLGGGRS